jgi:hypothetical protein
MAHGCLNKRAVSAGANDDVRAETSATFDQVIAWLCRLVRTMTFEPSDERSIMNKGSCLRRCEAMLPGSSRLPGGTRRPREAATLAAPVSVLAVSRANGEVAAIWRGLAPRRPVVLTA